MALSLGKLLFEESDVTCPSGKETNDAYDLQLYEHATDSSLGYLKVKMTLQIFFRDGEDNSKNALEWDHGSRQTFLDDYKQAVYSAWDNQWDIKCTSGHSKIETVRVFFFLDLQVRDWYLDEHYEVTVTKTDDVKTTSSVNAFWGNANLDSKDMMGRDKGAKIPGCSGAGCAMKQRGAVHEFGHMLGLRDEYPEANDPTAAWHGDTESIMNRGEIVRPRHYAMFADWLTEQYAYSSKVTTKKIKFKVDGTWDLTNSSL